MAGREVARLAAHWVAWLVGCGVMAERVVCGLAELAV